MWRPPFTTPFSHLVVLAFPVGPPSHTGTQTNRLQRASRALGRQGCCAFIRCSLLSNGGRADGVKSLSWRRLCALPLESTHRNGRPARGDSRAPTRGQQLESSNAAARACISCAATAARLVDALRGAADRSGARACTPVTGAVQTGRQCSARGQKGVACGLVSRHPEAGLAGAAPPRPCTAPSRHLCARARTIAIS